MIKLVFAAAMGLLSLPVCAQDVEAVLALLDFRQVQNRIEVTVAIRGGASCQGVHLERRTENSEFELIDSYPGICGGTEFTEYYYLKDQAPLAGQQTFYRLQLGQVGASRETSFLFVPIDESGMTLFPNPAHRKLRLQLENADNLLCVFEVFDYLGEALLTGEFRSSSMELDVDNLPAGAYVVLVRFESGKIIRGRFMVE